MDITRQWLAILNYDFRGVASELTTAADHFSKLQGLLTHLGFREAIHKDTAAMVWLRLLRDSVAMTLTLPPIKLK